MSSRAKSERSINVEFIDAFIGSMTDSFYLELGKLHPRDAVIVTVMEAMVNSGAFPMGGCLRELIRLYHLDAFARMGSYLVKDIDAHFPTEETFTNFCKVANDSNWYVVKEERSVSGSVTVGGVTIDTDFCVGNLQTLFRKRGGRVDFDVNNLYLIRVTRHKNNHQLMEFTYEFRDKITAVEQNLTLAHVRESIRSKRFTIVMSAELISREVNLEYIEQRVAKMVDERSWTCTNRDIMGRAAELAKQRRTAEAVAKEAEAARAREEALATQRQQQLIQQQQQQIQQQHRQGLAVFGLGLLGAGLIYLMSKK